MEEPISRTLSGQITARIREKILSGAYAPGSPLLQDTIAAEYGTSKIPVREALVQLRSEGLVDIFSHRGFQVRPLSTAEVEEVYRLRLAIEPEAVAEGARAASDEDRAAAKRALAALNDALAADQLHLSGDLNCAFHLALAVPRLQTVTAEILYRLHTLSQRYVRMHLRPAGRIERAQKEHTAIYAAWTSRNMKEVKNLTRLHISETRDELAALPLSVGHGEPAERRATRGRSAASASRPAGGAGRGKR